MAYRARERGRPPNRIDPIRFAGTAMAALVIVAVFGFPFGAIFAVIIGFWAYLFLGLPIFWMVLRWSPFRAPLANAILLAGAGYVANIGTDSLYALLPDFMVPNVHSSGEPLKISLREPGKIYAPLLGAAFGLVYRPSPLTS